MPSKQEVLLTGTALCLPFSGSKKLLFVLRRRKNIWKEHIIEPKANVL